MMAAIRTGRGYSRSAFTLMELMVAVGILLGVMVMIGAVFSTATKAGGQATASSTIYRQLSQVTDVLANDLDKTDPASGLLGIARVDIRAQETERDNTLGYLHRADVLTLFTGQALDPYYLQELSPEIGLAQMSQVVYGHANFVQRDPAGNIVGTVKLIDPGLGKRSDIPASQWHLARRVVGFPSEAGTLNPAGQVPSGQRPWLTHRGFLESLWELYSYPWQHPLDPINSVNTWIPKGFFRFNNNGLDYYFFDWGTHAYRRGRNVDPFLLQGGYWWNWASGWIRTQGGAVLPGPAQLAAPALGWTGFDWARPQNLFYGGPDTRTVIDSKPPAGMVRGMASYFLPACSEFKVEYTYDDPREIIVDPNTGDAVVDASGNLLLAQPIRWLSPDPGEVLIWSKLPAESTNYGTAPPESVKNLTDPHRWPKALRITMKVWDQGDRLTEPVTRTIIHTWD